MANKDAYVEIVNTPDSVSAVRKWLIVKIAKEKEYVITVYKNVTVIIVAVC